MNIKKGFCNILLSILILTVSSCDRFYSYKGERYDLLTVALNSLLGAKGEMFMNPDGPTLEIIEVDEYGRVMFSYFENNTFSTYSLLISQKVKNDYVYYYADNNFISNADGEFSEEEISVLKNSNDWNQKLDEDKMIYNKIVKNKIKPNIDVNKVLEAATNELLGKDIYYSHSQYCTSDSFGRNMYVFEASNKTLNDVQFQYVIILSADLKYNQNSIMELKDYYNYQTDLKKLKDLNNWNQ